MPMHQKHFASTAAPNHATAWRWTRPLLAASFLIAATAATAAVNLPEATARHQEERAFCNSGQSHQDRATCLREAGAALVEARRGQLTDEPGVYQQNAMMRCDRLPPDDREACMRRMAGEGTISGSVFDGGLLRELVVTVDQ